MKPDLYVVFSFLVWTEFIADLLPLKHYSRFVVDYLGGLLDHHGDRVRKLSKDPKSGGGGGGRLLYSGQFFKIFDVIFNTAAFPNLNKQYKARLLELYPVIKVSGTICILLKPLIMLLIMTFFSSRPCPSVIALRIMNCSPSSCGGWVPKDSRSQCRR